MRATARNRALIGTLLCCASFASVAVCAQTREDYRHLIDTYASGDIQGAVSQLNRWPLERITELAQQPVLGDPRAPIMLHTEVAAALINIDAERATFHLDIARRHLGALAGRSQQDNSVMAFVRRWYEFAPTIYLLAGDMRNATRYVRDGLIATPGVHPLLYFYSAVGFEARAYRGSQSIITGRHTAGNVDQLLRTAASIFLRALSEDDHLACARLHLGWIHFQQRDSRARTDLERALSDAGDDEGTRYLAHLFLGAVAEREQRTAEAEQQYDAAQAVNPRYQSSYLALMRLAEARGDRQRARREAAVLASVDPLDDPWWNYTGGFNLQVLEWLRTDSRSR